jgi:hypothetical protein
MPSMRRLQRFVSATVLIALSGALAGCGSVSNWDPMDLLDFLDTKKKLPGDRKPVFPDGVPGLEQGVPKELYKGNVEQQQLQQQQQDAAAAAAPPAEEAKPAKRTAKSKGKGGNKPTTVGAAPAQDQSPGQDTDAAAAAPDEEGTPAAVPPAPKPKKQARRRTTSLPNDDPAAQQPPGQGAQPALGAGSGFPAPVPSGTFQR